MADERGASGGPGPSAEPPARTKKRVRTRQPTLIGMALTEDGVDPGSAERAEDAPIAAPVVPAAKAGAPTPDAPAAPATPAKATPAKGGAGAAAPKVKAPVPPSRPLGSKPFPKPSRRLEPAPDDGSSVAGAPADAPAAEPAPSSKGEQPAPPSKGERPRGRPPDVATSPATVMPAYGESPTSPSIDLPEDEGAPRHDEPDELAAEPTQITGPDDEDDEDFLARGEPIAGERTQVAAGPLESDQAPPRPDIAMEPTLPAASLADVAPRPEPPEPPPSDPFEGEILGPPTQIVGQHGVGEPAPTYSLDVESGEVALSNQATWVGEEPAAKKIPVGLLVGVGVAALALLGLGLAGGLWLLSGDGDDVGAVASEGTPDPGAGAGAEPSAARGAEGDGAETATEPGSADEASADEASADDEVGADDEAGAEVAAGDDDEGAAEDDEDAPPATGAVVPRDRLEGFELELPRLSRRARRLSEPQRRRMTTRIRARAFAAYRRDAHAEAEQLYREALTYNTWDVASVEGLARATAQQGRYPEALAWAELAVERNPRSAAAYRVLGDVWRQAGHPDEARRAYRRGLRRSPNDRWLRQRLRDLD